MSLFPLSQFSSTEVSQYLPALARAFAITLGAAVLLVFLEKRHRLLSRFFAETGHPLNLAVVRIAIFFGLLTQESSRRVELISSLPHELRLPPLLLGPIVEHLPIHPQLSAILFRVFAGCCVAAMVGLFTRWAALAAGILGLYVLGIPQFFGNVSHYHHLIWFAFILALSPCGDALSIDSLFKAAKRADTGEVKAPGVAGAYGFPIRVMLALLGVIYFFPGVWKVARGGWEWVFSDHLKIVMHAKWLELGGYTPPFRLDQYRVLMIAAAAGTILFELGFWVAALIPRFRSFAAVGGLLFHNGIGAFMGIFFFPLQLVYVAFVNWDRALRFLGRAIFPAPLRVTYDDSCSLCRRTIAILDTLNWLGRIEFIGRTGATTFTAIGRRGERCGYDAYVALVPRIPLLAPLWLVMILPPVRWVGAKLYNRVANSRSCSIVRMARRADVQTAALRPSRLLRAVAIFMFVCNVLFGVAGATDAWPFASYPTFSRIRPSEYQLLKATARAKDGSISTYELTNDETLGNALAPHRWNGLVSTILSEGPSEGSTSRLRALWDVWRRTRGLSPELELVAFHTETIRWQFDTGLREMVASRDLEVDSSRRPK